MTTTTPLLPRINKDNGTPIAYQIYDQYLHLIEQRLITTGEALPTTAELAAAIGTSTRPVKEAYEQLAAIGRVSLGRGTRTTVIDPPPVRIIDGGRYAASLDRLKAGTPHCTTSMLTAYGATPADLDVEIADHRIVEASTRHQQLMHIPAGTLVVRRELVESVRGRPVQIKRSVIPVELATGTPFMRSDYWYTLNEGTLGDLWELGIHSENTGWAWTGRIVARAITATESKQLARRGVWVMVDTRAFAIGDRVVELSEVVLSAPETIFEYSGQWTPNESEQP